MNRVLNFTKIQIIFLFLYGQCLSCTVFNSLCLPQRYTFLCYLLEMLLFYILYVGVQSIGIFVYCVRQGSRFFLPRPRTTITQTKIFFSPLCCTVSPLSQINWQYICGGLFIVEILHLFCISVYRLICISLHQCYTLNYCTFFMSLKIK